MKRFNSKYMLKKTGLTSVETLKKGVSNAVSLFTTILENLKKSQSEISEQIDLRDAEIAKLSGERNELDALKANGSSVIAKIEQILA